MMTTAAAKILDDRVVAGDVHIEQRLLLVELVDEVVRELGDGVPQGAGVRRYVRF